MELPLILSQADEPIHQRLTSALSDAIVSGRLLPGDALPSTRELASSLGVSRDTVVRSYQDLAGKGFISIKPARGAFVCRLLPEDDDRGSRQQTADSASLERLSFFAQRLLELPYAGGTAADLARLNYGAPPVDLLPSKTWRQLLNQRCAVRDAEILDYDADEIFGYQPLREEVCRFLTHSKGLKCQTAQVVVFSDSQSGIDLIARMLVKPGDLVVLENPGYSGARELFQAYGAKLHFIEVDDSGLRVDRLQALKERCKLLYCSPSHQDPTGAVMPLARRRELLAWAQSNCDFIVEDAFDSDYNYGSAPLPALQGMSSSTPVFYLYSFWKILFPLVTTGVLVVPEHLILPFERAKRYVDRNFSLTEHQTLTDFLMQGHLERHVYRTRQIYKKRRQALSFALKQCFGDSVDFAKESAGLHMSLRFDLPCCSEDLLECANIAGLMMVSTGSYYFPEVVGNEFLLDFAGCPAEQAMERVSQFAQAVKSA